MSNPSTPRYLQPHQAQQRPPTSFEDLLGDALERAFASGITELAPWGPTHKLGPRKVSKLKSTNWELDHVGCRCQSS